MRKRIDECVHVKFLNSAQGEKKHKQNQTQMTETERTFAIYDRLKFIF